MSRGTTFEVWRGPGSVLGRLERLDNLLMPFWWVLGAFCGPQEDNMAATWIPRRSPNRIKINAKWKQKSIRLGWAYEVIFQNLGANVAPKWRQVGLRKRIVVFSNRILILSFVLLFDIKNCKNKTINNKRIII